MSEFLEKAVKSEIKTYGENTSYVTKIKKILSKEFKNEDEAEKYANELGIGRTIFMGNCGLRLKR